MMKYKLIKEYPGSPNLGTIAEKESKIKSNTSYYYSDGDKRWCVYDYHVEDNPEYWKKVNDNLWWVVFIEGHIQNLEEYFSAWTAHQIECIYAPWEENRKFFKTKEEAEDYILYNKPCISINDIKDNVSEYFLNKLIRIVKSKL